MINAEYTNPLLRIAAIAHARRNPQLVKPAETRVDLPALRQLQQAAAGLRQPWMARAACRGKTHLFFPKGHKDITYISTARRICRSCPVQEECLEYALTFPAADVHGILGGKTSRQLDAIQKRRGVRPTRPTIAQIHSDRA